MLAHELEHTHRANHAIRFDPNNTHTHTHRCWWLAIDTTTTSTDAKLIGAIDIPHRYTEVALMQ